MQERIEPPILISRLMTFVMATALVVLVVLVITLDKMFPLNRPQVFFLTTENLQDKQLTLTEIPENMDDYQKSFVMEYVRERNEVVPDLAIMRAKWANSDNGIIKTRSTDDVFGDFVMTNMVNIIRQDFDTPFNIKCDVEFYEHQPVIKNVNKKDTYTVRFGYVCDYGAMDGKKYVQNYVIDVTLASTAMDAVRWAERMENPLGFRVSNYEVINNQDDPLNWTNALEEE